MSRRQLPSAAGRRDRFIVYWMLPLLWFALVSVSLLLELKSSRISYQLNIPLDGRVIALVHGLMGVIGLVVIIIGARYLHRFYGSLLEREERSRRLAEATFEGICFSEEGRIRELNPALASMLGCGENDLIGRELLEFVAARDREAFASRMANSSDGVFECTAVRNDGTPFSAALKTRTLQEGGREVRITALQDITDQKQAAQDLKESEKKYRLLAEHISDVVWQIALPSQVVTFISPSVFKLLGTMPEEIMNRPVDLLLTEQSLQDLKDWLGQDLSEFRQGRTAFQSELKRIAFRRSDGSPIWTEVSMTYLPGEDGLPSGIVGISRDITARMQMEDALTLAERRNRQLIDNLSEGVYQTSLDGQFLMANAAMAEILGYASAQELIVSSPDIAATIYEDPEDRKRFIDMILTDGRAVNVEVRGRTKRGNDIWLSLSGRAVRDSDGDILYLEGSADDVTERRAARELLFNTKRLWEQTFNAIPDLIFIVDRENRILNINRALAARLGLAPARIIGSLCYEAVHGTHQPPVFCPHNKAMLNKRSYEGEFFDQKLNGHFHLTVSPFFDEAGVFGGTVHVLRDVSDKKRSEEKERTLQTRLIHADKMKSLGMLVSSVAHEVNNPNNFIMFNGSLIANAWKDIRRILDRHEEEQGGYNLAGLPYTEMREAIPKLLVGISEGSQRIKAIVEKLRDFARTDRGSLEGDVNMGKVAEDAVMILQNQIRKHTDAFTLSVEDKLPVVRGNHQQLEQVLINLIVNALQSLGNKHAAVAVEVRAAREEGRVQMIVRDEGAGMTPEILQDVMEPFFTTKLDAGGTGLGLSISKTIIDSHAGTITFRSEPGSGTTVTVSVPAEERL